MDELKPCPFCGKVHEITETWYDGPLYGVEEPKICPVWVTAFEEDEARERSEMVRIYNNRPIEDALRAELEDARAKVAAREWPFNNQLSDYSTQAINATLTAQNETIKALRAEVARLTEALEYYANDANADFQGYCEGSAPARRALGRE